MREVSSTRPPPRAAPRVSRGRALAAAVDPPDQAIPASDFEQWTRPRLARLLRAARLDVAYHRGAGDTLSYRNEAGAEIHVLDLVGGFGAGLFGHNHPDLVAALRAALAAGRPQNAQGSVRALAGRLARRLSTLAGGWCGRQYVTTFANSGAETVEAALKHADLALVVRASEILARSRSTILRLRAQEYRGPLLHQFRQIAREATALLASPPVALAIEGAFHGKTAGALRLTENPLYRLSWQRWQRLVPTTFLPAGDIAALRAAVAAAQLPYHEIVVDFDGSARAVPRVFTNVVACFVEPVQGEGGIRVCDPAFARELRRLCDEGDFPLVWDEIQSGCGRTGSFLASEGLGVPGDYVLLSKALGGGLTKVGAMLVERSRYIEDFGQAHTSTFADDDLSCTVALRALDLVTNDGGALMRACRDKGDALRAALEALAVRFPDVIADVRGVGLMIGVELREHMPSPPPFLRMLAEQKMLALFLCGHLLHEERIRVLPTLSSPFTLRIEPSAFVAASDLLRFAAALERVAHRLRAGDVAGLCRFAFGDADASQDFAWPPGGPREGRS